MASLRPPERVPTETVAVPRRFLDWGHSSWSRLSGDPNWAATFMLEVDEWAAGHGFVLQGEFGGTDWRRLKKFGVDRPRRLKGPWPIGSSSTE